MRFPREVAGIITERVARFVTETTLGSVPQKALDLARLGVTDFTGVALAGCREPQSRIIMDYARAMGGSPRATVIAAGFRTSPHLAALVNGTVGHSLDYDDMAISLIGHPSVFLAPAILAVAEEKAASGADVLTAYVVGYETACHIARPVLQSHYVQGWHATATFGSLGAAAACGWLLKLDAVQMKYALGIAASLAGGLRQNFGTMTKPLHAGAAAANGVQATLLARAGFTADENIIEAPLGFARAFGHSGEVDWAAVSRELGVTFLIAGDEGLSIKPYPSCGFTHAAIDAALDIKKKQQPRVADITGIELGVTPFDKQILIHHRPKTGLEGKFSLEYCVARALASGEVRLRHFTDEAVAEPAVQGLMAKMKWVEKYPMPEMGTSRGFGTKSVAVTLKGGTAYRQEVAVPRGFPGNPLTAEDLNGKYRDCAGVVLGKDDVERSLALLTGLQKARDIRPLLEIIASGGQK